MECVSYNDFLSSKEKAQISVRLRLEGIDFITFISEFLFIELKCTPCQGHLVFDFPFFGQRVFSWLLDFVH